MTTETILYDLRVLNRRLETAKAMLAFWCGPSEYRRSILSAGSAVDAVMTALFEDDDPEILAEVLALARHAVEQVERLAHATWRGKLSPSEN